MFKSRKEKNEKARAKEEKEAQARRNKGAGGALDVSSRDEQQEDEKAQVQRILQSSFLKPFLEDDQTITDINYDGVKMQLQDNRVGPVRPKLQPTQDEVRRLMNQIANIQGSQLNNSNPIMDTEIGFLRVNAVDDSASPDGITFSIRVSRPRLAIADISQMTVGGLEDVNGLLDALIKAYSNIIISGETGTGKTELQKLLVGYIDDNDLIVLIEDTRDSHIKALYPEKNIKSWQTLTSDDRDRKYEISDFVKAGLRNFPKWMLVSETRGKEAGDMLDSAKTGHSIITTLHSTGAMDTPSRLMSMVRQAPAYTQVTDMIIGREITKFLRFGIHLESTSIKTNEGRRIVRRIKEIVEYTGYDEMGPQGTYLYRAVNKYNDAIGDYETVEEFGKISENLKHELQDKRVYHLLPERFKPDYTAPQTVVEPARTQQVQAQQAIAQTRVATQEPAVPAVSDAEAKILAMKKRAPKPTRQRPQVSQKAEPSAAALALQAKQAKHDERIKRQM